jgi:hypothetical protein
MTGPKPSNVDTEALQASYFTPFVLVCQTHDIHVVLRGLPNLPEIYERDFYITPHMNTRSVIAYIRRELHLPISDSSQKHKIEYVLSLSTTNVEGREHTRDLAEDEFPLQVKNATKEQHRFVLHRPDTWLSHLNSFTSRLAQPLFTRPTSLAIASPSARSRPLSTFFGLGSSTEDTSTHTSTSTGQHTLADTPTDPRDRFNVDPEKLEQLINRRRSIMSPVSLPGNLSWLGGPSTRSVIRPSTNRDSVLFPGADPSLHSANGELDSSLLHLEGEELEAAFEELMVS